MRVVAGSAKSLKLKTIEGMETRPTQDRIKETLFNMIQYDIPGSTFLDLFSGSGGIGIEALSRGAKEAYFVEKAKPALRCIRENLRYTKLDKKAQVLATDVNSAIRQLETKNVTFDHIFMDPPYKKGFEEEVLSIIDRSSICTEDTVVIVESSLDKNTNFRSYIQLYKYISGSLTEAEKDESGNDVYVYRTTRHTERQTEGGCDWKVSGYFIVSPDIVNSEGEAGAQTMDWATANGYLTAANTNIYSTPSFAVAKGCAAYRGKEGLDEPGTWRVPTRGECALILLFYKKMEETKATTGFQPFALSTIGATYYWSATEKGGDSKDVWSMRFYPDNQITGYGLNTGYYDKQKKSYYLRCIRDIPLK